MSKQGGQFAEGWPFRCEIVGDHPHAGTIGTCDPNQQLQGMALVVFEGTGSHGEDAAYADAVNVPEKSLTLSGIRGGIRANEMAASLAREKAAKLKGGKAR